LPQQPDFIVFTGDLTQTADDDGIRRKRMNEFRRIIKDLKASEIRFLAGEHDAALDEGQAFKEIFGKTHYTFEHKGVHFIALDNVSDPRARLGDEQLQWLEDDLRKLDKAVRIVVLTHRPLFDLAADWDWATPDGDKAIEMLKPFNNVVVLYGHIHQVNHHMTGNIPHHAAMGLMWPLPAPHSVPKKAPIPWDPAQPYKGLGVRDIHTGAPYDIEDTPLAAGTTDPVVKITARKFEFDPKKITLRKGVAVTLELTSLDRLHGFSCPELGIRADVSPGRTSTIKLLPTRAGTFGFHCDIFCGSGHEQMTGTIVVTE
jgi:heme/copper-type cytochrome/quinol oxidase subunit 2